MRRILTTTALALTLVLAGSLLAVSPADASAGDEAWFVQQINSARSSRGLAPLQVDGALTFTARAWSGSMAGTGRLAHDPNIGSSVSGWTRIGENVGYGNSRDQIWSQFMTSAQHSSNILGAYTHVGVGVVVSGGNIWVTQRFMAVAGAPAPAPPAPVVVTPAPAPTAPVVVAPAPSPAAPRSGAPAASTPGSGAGGDGAGGGEGGDGSGSGGGTSTTEPSPASVGRVSLMIDALHALEG